MSCQREMLKKLRNQYHGKSNFFSQYLMLAVSLAIDMRLDRKPIRTKLATYTNKRDPTRENDPVDYAINAEELRATTGVFYLSST
jgi:uncharacterized membrane-anchored protein YhcB (DUF1043 family)